MVIEIAELYVQPGRQAEFEAAIRHGLQTCIAQAEGVHGYSLARCVEDPCRYVMQIRWETVEAHLIGYRSGPLSTRFRELCRPFFSRPATMQHYEMLVAQA
jgi:quinol monooxygenase YgiN